MHHAQFNTYPSIYSKFPYELELFFYNNIMGVMLYRKAVRNVDLEW